MNKAELVAAVAENLAVPKRVVADVMDEILVMAVKVLGSKEQVKLSGFGTFHTVERAARIGRNPKTGDSVRIPAKSVVKFKPAKAVKELFA